METLVLRKMTLGEATEWRARLGNAANQLRVILFEGYERGAWEVLGYTDWTDCVKSLAEEYEISERHMWRLHAANQTENLLTPGSVGGVPEKQLRPLTALDPTDQPIIWQRAVETAPNGKVTAAHVQSVVDDYIAPKPHVAQNSGNNEWYTPAVIIEAARMVMGRIDLDPASNAIANEVVKADIYYDIQNDGLEQEWNGKVWMNPPYASGLIERFVSKLCYHYQDNEVTEAIVLVNNATETGWFQELAAEAKAICFPGRRVRFWAPDKSEASPLQGQAILYLGKNMDRFWSMFGKFGFVAERMG